MNLKMNKTNYFNKIKSILYILVPSICFGFWAIINLIRLNFVIPDNIQDFTVFYNSGKQILIDPSQLYNIVGYFYLPSFAALFSISISLFPFTIAYYIFYVFNYIFGVLAIIEFNKILLLMGLRKKIFRFIFIMIIFNGYFAYYIFRFNQTKFIVCLILLFIIRRELQFKKYKKVKNFSYNLINYSLFVFAIAIAPSFIFFLLIYIFHDIQMKSIFKKENLQIYCIVIFMFIIQNFLFVIYPSLLVRYLDGFSYIHIHGSHGIQLFYLREWFFPSYDERIILSIIFTTILIISCLILILNKNLTLEKKFGYFSIFYLFTGVYSYQIFVLLILFSFIVLLIIPYLNQEEKGIDILKKNILPFIGLLLILIINFMPPDFVIYEFFPILQTIPFVFFVNLRWLILASIMVLVLIILHLKKHMDIKSA